MTEFSEVLIQNTIDVWSPQYGYTLSEDEAIEIIQNLTRFLRVLLEIDRRQQGTGELDFNDTGRLREQGFTGFKTVEELWKDKSCIPKIKGVYLVLDPSMKADFVEPGVGGFFKNQDPNVSVDELESNYIPNSVVVYIGKAGGMPGKATLHSRLGQYLSFGQGKRVGHWGGRLIWQLGNHQQLQFCWKPTPHDDPRGIEKTLLQHYVQQFGKKPFANLTG